MEWPDLARRRAPRECALPEPRPSKKARLAQRHWLTKLAILFQKSDLPEAIEATIEVFDDLVDQLEQALAEIEAVATRNQ